MILLGTSDVGPAKYLIELSNSLKIKFECIGGELTNHLFSENGNRVNIHWKNSKPLVVITGTSLGNSLDKELVIWAKQKGIPSISIIEHWSWYRRRFELNGKLILPDFIFVNDQIAYTDAINEGLPEEKLLIAGNPVLEALYRTGDQHPVNKGRLLKEYNLPVKRIIVFVSEELASEFNTVDDEFMVLKEIIQLLDPSDQLVIKLHPEELEDKYHDFIGSNVSVLRSIDVYSLNILADVIIGMASMLLLELAMLRNDVISFRPNARKQFIGKRLSATINVCLQENLADVLKNTQCVDGHFRGRFKGSSKKIVSLVKGIMK